MDYTKMCRELLQEVGGVSNVVSSSCCATRLRLVLKEQSVVNDEAVRRIPGVKGVFHRCGQYQIVIGFGVSELLREFQKFVALEGDGL